jgi:hypothetical protein
MNTLIIKRPKDKEKLYSEAILKIYINDTYIEKIGQNETKEIEIQDSVVNIQAKYKFGYRSQKITIDLAKIKEIEILTNTKIEIHPLLFISTACPVFVFAMNHEKYQYLKIIAIALTLFLIIRAIVQFYRITKKGLLIEVVKEN